MVADAPLAEEFGAGAIGFGLLIACWGGGSVLGSFARPQATARTEPLWLVLGAVGDRARGPRRRGSRRCSPLVLVGADGRWARATASRCVAEQGIMQRRTPDAVRSRVMAAFEAVLSFGLAFAYIVGGPVLRSIGPQSVVPASAGRRRSPRALVLVLRSAPERRRRHADRGRRTSDGGTEAASNRARDSAQRRSPALTDRTADGRPGCRAPGHPARIGPAAVAGTVRRRRRPGRTEARCSSERRTTRS